MSAATDVLSRYLREREAVLQKGDRSGATLVDSWAGSKTTERDLALECTLLAFVRQAVAQAELTEELQQQRRAGLVP